jgi:hypothetical protein
MGAALLAASGVWYSCLSEAARAMVHERDVTEPSRTMREAYDEKYGQFFQELVRRGFIRQDPAHARGQPGG